MINETVYVTVFWDEDNGYSSVVDVDRDTAISKRGFCDMAGSAIVTVTRPNIGDAKED